MIDLYDIRKGGKTYGCLRISEKIRDFDYYGQPIGMNDHSKQTHQTVFGGIITILVSVSFFSFFLNSMIQSDKFYLKDTISTISFRFDYEKPQPAELMIDPETGKKRFDMLFYMNDLEFDNEDNRYGYFRLHQYTNMESHLDTTGKVSGHYDIDIPIGPCDTGNEDWWWLSGGINYYCPKFDESHFVHGGFVADKFSLLRLAIHICDDSEEAKQQKIA